MANYVLTPAAVRKLNRILRPNSGNTGGENYPSPVSPDAFPPPFTVRWSASEANGNGAWAIWLPDRAKLVMYSGAFVSTISGVAAATVLPTGWYTITGAQATTTTAYLVITVTTLTGAVTAEISTSAGQSVTGTTVYNILVASMASVAATGVKRVKQFVDSVVTLGVGGGGSVTLDDVSLDWNTNGDAQIKDWETGTPASTTTIAQDIAAGGGYGTLVERDSNGALKYKGCGTLAQLLGSSVSLSSQKILTGLSWSTSNHTLVISSATVTVANGVITAWVANQDETISTTNISSIIS